MATADADKLMKQANKHCDPSFFSMRIKADWEQAQPLYERAAKMYKAGKYYDKARYAFERAATGQERQQSPWQAGKLLEQAASCAKETGDMTQVAEISRRAAQLYQEAGRGSAAAEALSKAAKLVEDQNPQEASAMYLEAVEVMEEEGQETMALDIFRQAIGSHIKNGRYTDAMNMLMRFAMACDAAHATNSQCKAYLGAVVVGLYSGNATETWATYQDALGVDCFNVSSEALVAESLFDAYRAADEAAIKKLILSKPIFTELDNQVSKLARKLPVGDVKAMAAQLGGAQGPAAAIDTSDLNEDDLT